MSAPTIDSEPAADVGNDSAWVNFVIDNNGLDAQGNLKVGLKSDLSDWQTFENAWPNMSQDFPPYDGGTGFEVQLTGLNPSTTYYYQATISNSLGTNSSYLQSFTTASAPVAAQIVQDLSIDFVTDNTVSFTVGYNTFSFQNAIATSYSTSPDLSNPLYLNDSVNSAEPTAYNATVQDLAAATSYYIQTALNNGGTIVKTSIQSFTTAPYTPPTAPVVDSVPAANVTNNSAIISSVIYNDNVDAQATMKVGLKSDLSDWQNFENAWPDMTQDIPAQASYGTSFNVALDNLQSGTTYYFQGSASNSYGSNYSYIYSFTTTTG